MGLCQARHTAAQTAVFAVKEVIRMNIKSIAFDGGVIDINSDTKQVAIIFTSDIGDSTISALMFGGFRWRPKEKAWKRKLSPQSVSAAKRICNAE